MNTMHLIGSEDVARAGQNISSAADTISRAANQFDEAGSRLLGALEQHGYQMGALAEALAGAPSLRDYFIAHAPTDPQPWFEPVMPHSRSEQPAKINDKTEEERQDSEGYTEDMLSVGDIRSPRLAAYFREYESWRHWTRAWESDRQKQKLIQWPAAWADAMLKAREA